jgi:glycosyltransferase involved in cell wall biosynthesis
MDPIVCEEMTGGLRITVVTETYPPEVNGVAKSAARFAEGLAARGHRIQIIRPRHGAGDDGGVGELEQVLMRGISIPRYPDLKMGLPAKRALVRMWSFRRPDIVHVVTEGPLGWSALQAAAKLKLPVISDFRTNFHSYSSHYGVGWLKKPILSYLRRFHNRTLCTIVPTAAMRGELTALGFRRVRAIARGIDTGLYDPIRRDPRLRASWGAGPQDTVLLYVGRLAAEKNLAAVAAVYDRTPGTKLVIVGDGPERASLQARMPNAVFAGVRTGTDLAAHYASGDLFLFPSLTETYGNVTLEAMASGLAVVAFDYAAAGELIESGVNGVVVPRGERESFVSRAATLAAEPTRLREIGERARATCAEHSWERVVQQLEGVLLSAASDQFVAGQTRSARTARPAPRTCAPMKATM